MKQTVYAIDPEVLALYGSGDGDAETRWEPFIVFGTDAFTFGVESAYTYGDETIWCGEVLLTSLTTGVQVGLAPVEFRELVPIEL